MRLAMCLVIAALLAAACGGGYGGPGAPANATPTKLPLPSSTDNYGY